MEIQISDSATDAALGDAPAPAGFVRKWVPLFVMSLALVNVLFEAAILSKHVAPCRIIQVGIVTDAAG